MFFGFIDTIILGRFVTSEFIGYYKAASNLIGSIIPLIMFSGALLPIFSRMSLEHLERGFTKTIKAVFVLSIFLFIVVYLFSDLLIIFIYGVEYADAINVMRILSLLLISFPLISAYTGYFLARGNPKIVTILLIVATVASILFNYLFISYGISFGSLNAIIWASIATVFVSYLYLGGLIIAKRLFKYFAT